MYRPLATVTGLYIAGILFARYDSVLSVVLFFVSAAAFSDAVMLKKHRKKYNLILDVFVTFVTVLIGFIMFLGGIKAGGRIKTMSELKSAVSFCEGENLCFDCIVKDILIEEDSVRITAEVCELSLVYYDNQGCTVKNGVVYESSANNGRECVYINIDRVVTLPREGDEIEFISPLYFFEKAYNDGEFDSEKYYLTRNIAGNVYPDEILTIKKNDSLYLAVLRKTVALRRYIKTNLKRVYDSQNAGTMISLVTGDKSELDSEVKDRFAFTGIAHILVVSGLHISFICYGLFSLLRKAGCSYPTAGITSFIFIILLNVFYGMTVSCVRSSVMFAFLVASKLCGRLYDGVTALFVAAFLVLFGNEAMLYDSSFILSFAAGAGVIYARAVIKCLDLKKLPDGKAKMIKNIVFCFLMQLVMLPLQLAFYYYYSPYSIFLNLIIVPLTGCLLGCGIAAGIAGYKIFLLGSTLAFTGSVLLAVYNKACDFTIKLPFSKIVTGHLTGFKAFLALTALLLTFVLLKKTKSRISFLCLGLYLVVLLPNNTATYRFLENKAYGPARIISGFIPGPNHDYLNYYGIEREDGVYMLYVGQGECNVILKGKTAVIIDCGSSDENLIYKYSVERFLYYHGHEKADVVFISHDDIDHVSGMLEIADETIVYIPDCGDDDLPNKVDVFGNLQSNEKLIINTICKNDIIKIDELSFKMLYPFTTFSESENENSMVLLFEYGDFRALYTGDIGFEQEEEIADDFNCDIDLLKVPHHGSAYGTGEELLELFSPEKAFISAGIGNSYGHPTEETLERLKKYGVDYHVTVYEGQLFLPFVE